jgi:DNA-binding CsgD family transcriptional regulator
VSEPGIRRTSVRISPQDRRAIYVSCDLSLLRHLVVGALTEVGFRVSSDASTIVLLDAPLGHALRVLPNIDRAEKLVVAMWNVSREYEDEVYDLQPDILVDGVESVDELAHSVKDVLEGKHYRRSSLPMSCLTHFEVEVLRLTVQGLPDKLIAQRLNKSQQTISNALGSVREKLSVANRVELMSYYYSLHRPDR